MSEPTNILGKIGKATGEKLKNLQDQIDDIDVNNVTGNVVVDGDVDGINLTATGDLSVGGALECDSLTVKGVTKIINTQTVEVSDNVIELNRADNNSVTATTAGIDVNRGFTATRSADEPFSPDVDEASNEIYSAKKTDEVTGTLSGSTGITQIQVLFNGEARVNSIITNIQGTMYESTVGGTSSVTPSSSDRYKVIQSIGTSAWEVQKVDSNDTIIDSTKYSTASVTFDVEGSYELSLTNSNTATAILSDTHDGSRYATQYSVTDNGLNYTIDTLWSTHTDNEIQSQTNGDAFSGISTAWLRGFKLYVEDSSSEVLELEVEFYSYTYYETELSKSQIQWDNTQGEWSFKQGTTLLPINGVFKASDGSGIKINNVDIGTYADFSNELTTALAG